MSSSPNAKKPMKPEGTSNGFQKWIREKLGLIFLKSPKVDHAKLAACRFTPYSAWLKENLRGRDREIDDIFDSIQKALIGVGPGKVIGSYLFVGDNGTGKVFLSELLAKALFPQSERILFYGHNFKHPDDIYELLGPPPNRFDAEKGGALTRPVLENPYRAIILDEIELAHPALLTAISDIFKTGRCREKSSGKTVDFSGCIFFGVSSAPGDQIREVFNHTEDPTQRRAKLCELLNKERKIELSFLEKWDRIIFMDELQPVHELEKTLLLVVLHWKLFGIEITHQSPDLMLAALEKNEEYRMRGGVRSEYVRNSFNTAVARMRAAKPKKIRLEVAGDGQFVVQPVE